MRIFFRNHPILFAIFILFASRIVGLGVAYLIQIFFPELNPIKDLGWLIQILFASTALALVYWSGDAKGMGLSKPVSKKEWLLWIPPLIIPILIVLSFGFNVSDFSKAVVLAISALCVAVNEEIIFRGALVKGLLRFGTTVTIIAPAVLFGLIHIGNVFGGADLLFSIYQIVWGIAGGIAFTALRLRNQSIYPAIVFHFIVDYIEYLSTGENGVHQTGFSTTTLVMVLTLSILFAIYALVLFKKNNQKTIHLPGEV